MNCINVSGLKKTYKTYKKEKGLKGTIHNLFKREILYKDAVKNISFQIEEGEIVGFVGMNGAGKTTTLKMLAGILQPSSGEIDVNGFIPFEKKDEYLKQITMVMGNKSQLWWDIPAIDSFELNRDIYNIEEKKYKQILEELVKALDVEDLLNVQVRKLSLGERMKMELIAALLHEPKILFLDEPTIGIDIISQKSIYDFLMEYRKKHNTTIMLTSHNFDDITALCDKLILINEGSIIYNDTYEKFMQKYNVNKIFSIHFTKNIDSLSIEKLAEKGEILEKKDNILKLSVLKSESVTVTKILTTDFEKEMQEFTIENMDIKELIRKIYEKG